MMRFSLRFLFAKPLPGYICVEIERLVLLAFNIGQFAGMIDKRAEGPAKYIRGWTNQKKSAEAKTAWKVPALKLAKSICDVRELN
jgi:hypothetical protein